MMIKFVCLPKCLLAQQTILMLLYFLIFQDYIYKLLKNKITMIQSTVNDNPFQSKVDEQQDNLYALYKRQKQQSSFPTKISLYFSTLQQILEFSEQEASTIQPNGISKSFILAFSQMSRQQKLYFLYHNIKYIKQKLRGPLKKSKYDNQSLYMIPNVDCQCQVKMSKLKISYWSNANFKFRAQKKLIRLVKKYPLQIDLRMYLVRLSQRYSDTIVLMGCSDELIKQNKKYYISFQKETCKQIYRSIRNQILLYRNQRLLEDYVDKIDYCNSIEQTLISANDKPMIFLNQKAVTKFLSEKQKFLKEVKNASMDYTLIHHEQNIKISSNASHERCYKLQAFVHIPYLIAKRLFLHCYKDKFAKSKQTQILQKFSERYSAVYHKINLDSRQFEMIEIREENTNPTHETVLTIQGANYAIELDNFIDFLTVQIVKIEQQTKVCKMTLYAQFNKNIYLPLNSTIQYLKEFVKMFYRSQSDRMLNNVNRLSNISAHMPDPPNFHKKEEYYTIQESEKKIASSSEINRQIKDLSNVLQQSSDSAELELEKSKSPPTLLKNKQSSNQKFEMINMKNEKSQSTQISNKIDIRANLKYRYELKYKQSQRQKKRIVKHLFQGQWQRKKAGGIYYINKARLKEQGQVVMHIAKTMGNNIIKSKNVMNISLPIGIFQKESHLITVARSFTFAPLLLQNVVDKSPKEKLQACITFSLGVGNTSIIFGKPFNPLLGETYQGWIDGCPIYLQQISHHPPICSYLFYGRGYKAFGQIKPQVSATLNGIHGINTRKNFVEFADGTIVQIGFPSITVKGFIFGDRQFQFYDPIYAFDKKNHLFATGNFGSKKKGFLSSSSQPQDYFYGYIAQVSEEYCENAAKNHPPVYPKETEINRKLCEYDGIWMRQIKINGKTIINFETDLPCDLEEEIFPLPSNSWLREDLRQLILDHKEQAQQKKQEIQQQQRADRKLRQKYHK